MRRPLCPSCADEGRAVTMSRADPTNDEYKIWFCRVCYPLVPDWGE